jgi:hypothetical protein
MLDILSESIVPLSEVSSLIPTHPSYSAVYRWHRDGIRGVHLETVLIGGSICTSREALQRFLRDTNAAAAREADGRRSAPRTSSVRKAQITQAGEQLRAMGI